MALSFYEGLLWPPASRLQLPTPNARGVSCVHLWILLSRERAKKKHCKKNLSNRPGCAGNLGTRKHRIPQLDTQPNACFYQGASTKWVLVLERQQSRVRYPRCRGAHGLCVVGIRRLCADDKRFKIAFNSGQLRVDQRRKRCQDKEGRDRRERERVPRVEQAFHLFPPASAGPKHPTPASCSDANHRPGG